MKPNSSCQICNKRFYAKPNHIKKGWGIYCSRKCKAISQKGKHNSPKTEFKKGRISNRKGMKVPQISGDKHWNWNNGKSISRGYIYIRKSKDYPIKHKYMLEQRAIAEKYLKRPLKPKEIVHHIDNNGLNNDPKNLYVFQNIGIHRSFHSLVNAGILKLTFLKTNLL